MHQHPASARGHAAPERHSYPDDHWNTDSLTDGYTHVDADANRSTIVLCSMVCVTQRAVEPTPQRGAPCGVVDFFDFPLAAPEGDGAGARWSFGRYSERYSGIHAGEDWVYDSGRQPGAPRV